MGYSKEDSAYTKKKETETKDKKKKSKELPRSPITPTLQPPIASSLQPPIASSRIASSPIATTLQVEDLVSLVNNEQLYKEEYFEDDEFRTYTSDMNMKREHNDITQLNITLAEVLSHLNKRLMYIEFKSDISYEKEQLDFLHYERAISKLNE